jgi:APA family basic amino acid/polyamine antiporter
MRVTWLKRDLRTIDLIALGYSDVSSTYYFLLGIVALYSGQSLAITMILGSLSMWIAGLAYAEFGSAIPRTGGAYYYVRRELGDLMGFLAGWLLSLDQILMIAYGALGAVNYLGGLIPPLSTWPVNSLAAMAIIAALMTINILGIKTSARFNLALLTIDLLGIFTLLTIGYATLLPRGSPVVLGMHVSINDVIRGLAYSIRGYIGIDVIAQSTGEALTPFVSVPRAIISVSSLSTAVALALSLLALLTNSVTIISSSINDPIGALARHLIRNAALSTYVAISVAIVLLIAVNAGIVDFSRSMYVMGEDGLLPRVLGKVHGRYRTPYIAIVISSVIAMLFVVPGSVELIAGSYGIASIIVYLMTMVSLARFRNAERELVSYFRTPEVALGGVKVPIVSLVGSIFYTTALLFIALVKPEYLAVVTTWVLIGLVIHMTSRFSLRNLRQSPSRQQ